MSNRAAGKGSMRLRPGKNRLPSGNVLSRLRKCVHAIARKTSTARKLPTQARIAEVEEMSHAMPMIRRAVRSMQNSSIQLCSNILK
jgi:hypothetical protein